MVKHSSPLHVPLSRAHVPAAILALLISVSICSAGSAEFTRKSGYGKISSVYTPQSSMTPAQAAGRPGIDRPYTEAKWYAKVKADMGGSSGKPAVKTAKSSPLSAPRVSRPSLLSTVRSSIANTFKRSDNSPQTQSVSGRPSRAFSFGTRNRDPFSRASQTRTTSSATGTNKRTTDPAARIGKTSSLFGIRRAFAPRTTQTVTISPITTFDPKYKMCERSMVSVPGTSRFVFKAPGAYIATVKVHFPFAARRTIPPSKSTITQLAPELDLLDITNGDAVTRLGAANPPEQPFVRPEEIRYTGRAFSPSELTTIANTVTLLPHYLLPKGFAAGRHPDGLADDQKHRGAAFMDDGYACFLDDQGNDYYSAQYLAAHEIGHVYFGEDQSSSYLSPSQRREWVGIWNQSVKKGLPDDDFTYFYAQLNNMTKTELNGWRNNPQEQIRVSEYKGNDPLTITTRRSNGEGRTPTLVVNNGIETMSSFNSYWFMNSETLTNQAIEKAQAGNDVLLQKVNFFTKSIYGQNKLGQACIGHDATRSDQVYTFTMGDDCISRQQVKTKNIQINDKIYLVPDFENPVDTQIILHMGLESSRKSSEDIEKWMQDRQAGELRKI